MTMDDALPSYTPQAITDILPIYCPANPSAHILTYTLRQSSSTTQSLVLTSNHMLSQSSYDIKSRATGGFMNKKPHVVITSTSSSTGRTQNIAEGRFGIHGTGTTIDYLSGDGSEMRQQELELQDSLSQLLKTKVGGKVCWWQPHPGNKGVLELTNEYDEVIARFVHREDQENLSRQNSDSLRVPASTERRSSVAVMGKKAPKKAKEGKEEVVGELQVVDELVGGEEELGKDKAREEVLCSAIMVVERAKRRKAMLSRSGEALRGPASWGWNGSLVGPTAGGM